MKKIFKPCKISNYLSIGLIMLIWFVTPLAVSGQSKYWITFTDKGDISQYTPEMILSPRALENRKRQGIGIDMYDYPVNSSYIQSLKLIGVKPVRISKWINGVTAYLKKDQLSLVSGLSFVRQLRPVGTTHVVSDENYTDPCDSIPFLNSYIQQLNMLGVDTLHQAGYTGKGVLIAVFDNGYFGVNATEGFRHLFDEEQIIATWDYVEGDEDVFGICSHCRHGTSVLSTLAAIIPEGITGTAPDADYILLRTENDSSETHQEEDNWVAAAEFADSLGAQIFSTSLGYRDGFTDGQKGYTIEDMDGNSTIITRAADIAASRGILVVNSAGNSGEGGIVAPADGDSVIAVGAVNICEEIAGFSSNGPSADGRIKPDVSALGQSVFVYRSNGTRSRANGTSFSCPLVSGLLACVVQAYPAATRTQVQDALIRSADRFANPDPLYGYGIPSAGMMQQLLGATLSSSKPEADISRFSLYPNPNSGTFFLTSFHQTYLGKIRLELFDTHGKKVFSDQTDGNNTVKKWEIQTFLPDGLYFYRLIPESYSVKATQGKMLINSTLEP